PGRAPRLRLNELDHQPRPNQPRETVRKRRGNVRKSSSTRKEPRSVGTPIGDEEDSHLGDLIEDKNAILPIDAMIQSNLRETTTRVLASLAPREERIVRMRFGLGLNCEHTLEEVGLQFSVTRERIGEIEAKGMRSLIQ